MEKEPKTEDPILQENADEIATEKDVGKWGEFEIEKV